MTMTPASTVTDWSDSLTKMVKGRMVVNAMPALLEALVLASGGPAAADTRRLIPGRVLSVVLLLVVVLSGLMAPLAPAAVAGRTQKKGCRQQRNLGIQDQEGAEIKPALATAAYPV